MIRRNLREWYHVTTAPSDTGLRERLDRFNPKHLRRPFKKIFAPLQRGKVLASFQYLGGHHIISIDGTGQYSSTKVHCQHCCEKKSTQTGTITDSHPMRGAVLVPPEPSIVIPLAPEPIVKADGAKKNDGERNAAKRWLSD